MAKKKIYAVRKGHKTGLFETWAECQKATSGYSGAEFRGFTDREEAMAFLQMSTTANVSKDEEKEAAGIVEVPENMVIAYVDGSYQDALKKYGFGCIFILPDGRIYTEYGNGDNPDSLKQRNVSGEMLGAMYAVRFALNSGFTAIEIRYDYEGIEKWVTRAWKSKNELTQKYAQTMRAWGQKIQIRFTKVPAHSKVKYNELADETAKLGVANGNGIPKVKSLSDFEAADAAERMQDAAE